MTLNEKLSKLRKGLGLSQEELAESLNVSRQAVSKWETGQSAPDLENLVRLCKLYGIPADELLETGLTPATTPDNTALPVIQAGLARRFVTLGWSSIVISAVLFVLELIALFSIRRVEIASAIARGAGYIENLSWYASHFPMNLVFAVTTLLALFGGALVVYGVRQGKGKRKMKR